MIFYVKDIFVNSMNKYELLIKKLFNDGLPVPSCKKIWSVLNKNESAVTGTFIFPKVCIIRRLLSWPMVYRL